LVPIGIDYNPAHLLAKGVNHVLDHEATGQLYEPLVFTAHAPSLTTRQDNAGDRCGIGSRIDHLEQLLTLGVQTMTLVTYKLVKYLRINHLKDHNLG
jgi:hypothetical protein